MSSVVRILVPVDFSECSRLAVKVAVGMADRLAATVDVVHVWDVPGHRKGASQVVTRDGPRTHAQWALAEIGRDVEGLLAGLSAEELSWVHTRIERGKPVPTIVELSEDYDLLLMGTHGRTGMAHVWLGSVAEKVVQRVRCPVLTTRHPQATGVEDDLRKKRGGIERLCHEKARFLVAVDFSDCSRLALKRTIKLADELGAQVEVLHVVELPESVVHRGESWSFPNTGASFVRLRARGAEELAEFVHEFDETGQRLLRTVRMGRVHENIISYAKSGSYDLLALGTHGRKGWSHIWLGSIAEQVVRHAPCPVLTVRETRERARDRDYKETHTSHTAR
jgi:nucleotide-binding universal stress UspA family protein